MTPSTTSLATHSNDTTEETTMTARLFFVLCLIALSGGACGADETHNVGRGNGSMDGDPSDDPSLDPSNPSDPGSDPTPSGMGTGSGGGTTTPMGDCGAGCTRTSAGPGGDSPFDPDAETSENVGLDPDGALILRREADMKGGLIWISSTALGMISKVDTETMTELGRYRVAPWAMDEQNGPSRTTVDSEGNVYVGLRTGTTISKVSAAGAMCPDTNGDGVVTTSTGPADVLPFGQDDCLIWTTEIGHDARGIAVQEIPGKVTIEHSPDKEPVVTETPAQKYVWITGISANHMLHKLDAETGQILFSIKPPTTGYGMALDGVGNLWLSGRGTSPVAIGRVDTTRCVDAGCGTEMVCTHTCTSASCPGTCDDAILEKIEVPGVTVYGITVDCRQRVWTGVYNDASDGGMMMYDPLGAGNRMTYLPQGKGMHGIAADGNGHVWAAADSKGVYRADGMTLQVVQVAGTTPGAAGTGGGPKGMSVDRQGKVWAIPIRGDLTSALTATVITPGPTVNDATVAMPFTGFAGSYTYSDMTGEQNRLASNEPGSYRQVFEGCTGKGATTKWKDLEWDVDAPAGTVVVFRVRSADTMDGLESADWIILASLPGPSSPLELDPYFAGAMQETGKYVEVQVELLAESTEDMGWNLCANDMTELLTPRVKEFGVTFTCDIPIE
jgi:hypothetical protein